MALRDEIDRQIVALLVQDARRSFADIGEHVGLSAPAVKRRVDRLEDAGVILGYAARVDRNAEGKVTETFVELFCSGRTTPADIKALVEPFGQVIEAFTVSGEADALLMLRTRDMAEFEETLEAIRANSHVDRTKTVIVLSRLIDRA
ncbi:MAG TPA: Lrp/AsnC family transcriptional regulator [Acidimicrobiales bacterium]|nr:Lrp/AsnC family transcriptional regulator [Acidimicrobiales bacterium]